MYVSPLRHQSVKAPKPLLPVNNEVVTGKGPGKTREI